MTLEQALRGVAKAISPLHTPAVRAIIASKIPKNVATGDSSLWMTLEEFAACFHPNDAIKAKAVLSQLKSAHADGQITSIHESAFPAETLAMWPECPPISHDSPLVYWFGAMGVNTLPEAAPVPNDETIEARNKRWLERYEREVKTALRGAYARGAAHFDEEASKYRKAVVKARARRAIDYRADIRAVPAKAGAANWGSQLVKDGKRTKGTKA